MTKRKVLVTWLALSAFGAFVFTGAAPQSRFLAGVVKTTNGATVSGATVTLNGVPGSTTSDSGRFVIALPESLAPGDPITLGVTTWIIVSPLGGRTWIPKRETDIVEIFVGRRGDPALLDNKQLIQEIVEGVTARLNPQISARFVSDDFLEITAHELGFKVEQLKGAINDWSTKVEGPYQKGLAALYARRFSAASDYFKESIKSAESDVASKYLFLANSEYEQEHYAVAQNALEHALNIRNDDPTVLENLGVVFLALGNFEAATNALDSSLASRHNKGTASANVQAFIAVGSTYNVFGDYDRALHCFREALDALTAAGDSTGRALVLSHMASVHDALGEEGQALDLYNQALNSIEDSNSAIKANILTNIGSLYLNLGQMSLARQFYEQALELVNGSSILRVTIITNLGKAHHAQGHSKEALQYFKEALSLPVLSQDDSAAEYPDDQAPKLLGRIEIRKSKGLLLIELGGVYAELSRPYDALKYYDDAIRLLRSIGARPSLAMALNERGMVYEHSGNWNGASACFQEALQLSRDIGEEHEQSKALYGLARVEQASGDLPSALKYAEASIDKLETLRLRITDLYLRRSFFSLFQDLYDLHINLLMKLHRLHSEAGYDRLALEAAEMAQARTLRDMLVVAKADVPRTEKAAPLLDALQKTRISLALKYRRLGEFSNVNLTKAAGELTVQIDALMRQANDLEGELIHAVPQYQTLVQPRATTVSEVQSFLDQETTLLLYKLGEENSYLWLVDKDSINVFELPGRIHINRLVAAFYRSISDYRSLPNETIDAFYQRRRSLAAMYRRASAALSDLLLKPVGARLGSKRLLIVPDGALAYVPFAALAAPNDSPQGTKRWLIETHEIVNLPSISILPLLRSRRSGSQNVRGKIAVFADPVFNSDDPRVISPEQGHVEAVNRYPRLVYSRREAAAIAALSSPETGVTEALDFDANLETVRSFDFTNFSIVHFATHGILDSEQPDKSGLVLSLIDRNGRSKNGILGLEQIVNLRMPVDLVVLSGCETGLGKEVQGEGLVGVARSFMAAGAARVVASLWPVDDAATATLMKAFYRAILQEKLTPAAALRKAQLEMARDPRWASPFFWAGFVIEGDWK